MFTSFNGTQILLSVMIVLLGITLVIVGIQLFFVLKDVRKSLARTDRILADVETITSRLSTEQQYLDDILQSVHSMLTTFGKTTTSLSSVSKLIGQGSLGLSFLKTFTAALNRNRHSDTKTS